MKRGIVLWTFYAVFAVLVLVALCWACLVAFGHFPALGGHDLHVGAFKAFLQLPQLPKAVFFTLLSAFIATIISLLLSFGFLATFAQKLKMGAWQSAILTPILAVPHSLLAMSVVVLFAPTGWMIRSFWWLTDKPDIPPHYLFAPDGWGVGMVLALVCKETVFLLLILFAYSSDGTLSQQLKLARSLGYSPVAAWGKIILPQLYPKMRLPILAVLVYGVSNVDIPLVTNSFDTPTVSLLILRLYQHPDLHMLYNAAAGSIFLMGLCVFAIAFWFMLDKAVKRCLRYSLSNGGRRIGENIFPLFIGGVLCLLLVIILLGLVGMVVQSFSFRWAFPDIVPQSWIFHRPRLFLASLNGVILGNSVLIAFFSSLFSLIIAVLGLVSFGVTERRILSIWVYLPLMLPQVTVMLGVQLILFTLHVQPSILMVTLFHCLFVLPYIYLSLAGAYQNFDWRYVYLAQSFGLGWWQRLYRVILPLTLRPLMVAFALGFSVSMAQYLTTLLVSQGRVETLMTHFMNGVSGGNGREIAQLGLILLLSVAVPFCLAIIVPNWIFRHRRGMRLEQP